MRKVILFMDMSSGSGKLTDENEGFQPKVRQTIGAIPLIEPGIGRIIGKDLILGTHPAKNDSPQVIAVRLKDVLNVLRCDDP